MKRNIFIRVVCLLLCVSMLTPIAASATGGTPTPRVITTNEMAYVDLFFHDDGRYSPLGDDLKKWLDMTPKVVANGNWEDSAERVGSGYLMLEQEMHHQNTSMRYMAADVYIKTARVALETIGTAGTNLISAAASEGVFNAKFPGAGKSAYVYYQYLYQLYFDYLSELQTELQEVDNTFKTLAEVVGDVVELSPELAQDSANLYHDVKLAYVRYEKLDSIAIMPERYQNNVRVVELADIDDLSLDIDGMPIKDASFMVETATGIKSQAFDEMMKPTADGYGVVFRISQKLEKKLGGKDKALKWINDQISQRWDLHGAAGIDTSKLKPYYLEGCIDGVRKADGFDKLPKHVQGAFTQMDNDVAKTVPELNIKKQYAEVFDTLEKVGKAADVISAGADVYSYFKNKSDVTAQQLQYLNVAANVTRDYLDMLEEWYHTVGESNSEGQEDIRAALAAIMLDILIAQNATVDEIEKAAKNDAYIITFDSLSKTILSVVDTVAGIRGAKDALEFWMSHKKAANASAGMAVFSIGSAVLNATTDRFVEFGKNSEAIHNLKLSLYDVLTNEQDGLLAQYRRNRSHQLALAIICTLNTMKSAKIMGEGLVEEYYLYDMYRSLDIEASGPVHLVLMSELMQWNGEDPFYAKFSPIITVYEDLPVLKIRPSYENVYEYYHEVTQKILGYYYPEYYYRTLTYKGVAISWIPSCFKNIPSKPMPYDKEGKPFGIPYNKEAKYVGIIEDEEWLKGNTATGYDERYIYQKMGKLYSKNGIEIILTEDEYEKYEELQSYINKLIKKHNDPDEEIKFWDWNADDEQQMLYRLEWTILTKRWIEKVKMFDKSEDYISKSKTFHLAWAQDNP